MERLSVESSVVASVGYDAVTGVLELEFHSGGVYRYFLVPPSVYRDLVGAGSIGRAFGALVRDRYRVERIE